MALSLPPYLETLNPEQREAVLHTGHPLLILAGAGSGKTRVITTKIAWLIREKGVDPHSILAVTFTNKAAREMAGRAQLIEGRAASAMLRTFHSFGAWLLRRYGNLAGLDPGFVIYDDDDTVALLETIMEGSPKAEVKTMAYKIARAKDYFLSPNDPELDFIEYKKSFKNIYTKYEERLVQIGNVDFGDLIKKPVEILRNSPEVARRLQERFKVILVDEYQDANVAQSELLKGLYGSGSYLCVVGDDDQSIYSFRGAEVKNILKFPDSYENTDIIRLERNYRSTIPILRAADSVVDHNKGRLGKKLKAEKGDGKTPVLAFLPNQDAEAEFCAELVLKSHTYSGWAVIYRTNAQSLGFETEFLRRKIPYKVIGSLKFYEREEIKDSLALLSFLVNPKDEIAFRRMVNKPSRGLGPATVDRIVEEAMSNTAEAKGDLAIAAQKLSPVLTAKARLGIISFLRAIDAGKASVSAGNTPSKKNAPDKTLPSGEGLKAGVGLSACVVNLVKESGIAEYHLTRDELTGNQRLNNLQELANAASLYKASREGLLEFLEHIELDRSLSDASEKESGNDAVTLITLHNTKGLEFPRVIITGIEQGIFPRDDKEGEDLEEERRLFYVGATRAMDELYLSSCTYRRMYGRTVRMEPSLFLNEIDHKGLRVIGSAPHGFRSHQKSSGLQFYEQTANSGSRALKSSDGRWTLGDRVYHDDHGYGSIAQIRDSEDGPVVKVVFETGYEKSFLSLHQSSKYTKIGED